MSIIETFLNNYIHELAVCEHLYSKLDPAQQDWRPAENMRSTVELLQYLCYIGKTLIKHYIDPVEDATVAVENYHRAAKWSVEAVTFANFPEMIKLEAQDIRASLAKVSDADLMRMTYHPFGAQQMTLFEGMIRVLRYLTAYRHQLFLYAKMCGAEIYTSNNWAGKDRVQPVAVAQ